MLKKLRYKPAGSTHAPRPKKTDKLPPGASYTCRAGGDTDDGDEPVAGPSKPRHPDSSSEDYNSSDNESDRERSRTVKNIVQRLARKRPLLDEDEDEDDDEEDEDEEQAEEEGTSEETNKDELAGKDQEKKGGK